MLIQGCPQSLRKGRSGAPRPAQREIPLALIHHQHEGFLRNRRFPGAVVLRQPRLPPVLHQGARSLTLGRIQRLGNQDIQLGWLAGVVIDAPRIQHQPQWGLFSPGAHRAQKAVFTTPQRQPPPLSFTPSPVSTWLLSPSQQGLKSRIPTASRTPSHQLMGLQQHIQIAEPGQRAVGNTKAHASFRCVKESRS